VQPGHLPLQDLRYGDALVDHRAHGCQDHGAVPCSLRRVLGQ
jgi:hypothetical protein